MEFIIMGATSTNDLKVVQGYIGNTILPFLANTFTITLTVDSADKDWNLAEKAGTRGDRYEWKIPPRTQGRNSLGFDADTTGSYIERRMSIVADNEYSTNYGITGEQEALNPRNILSGLARSNILEMANIVERFNADQVALGGYRFFGSPIVQQGQMQSVGEIDDAIEKFRAFGGQGEATCAIPNVAKSAINQTALQQFAPKRNDDEVIAGEIGYLGGVSDMLFVSSTQLPTHVAGTVSTDTAGVNAGAGYTITSVTPTEETSTASGTSVIVLEGMTDGDTVVANDMLDIGALVPSATAPLKFLQFTGYQNTNYVNVQCRVTVGGTVASNAVTITVEPALIFDGGNTNTQRNLSRAIVVGASGDKVRFAQSHVCGAVYFKSYVKFACPKLGPVDPWGGASVYSPEIGMGIRNYYGMVGIGKNNYMYVHDMIYGGGTAGEGIARILFPIPTNT